MTSTTRAIEARNDGFTIIELLVVLIILGLLASFTGLGVANIAAEKGGEVAVRRLVKKLDYWRALAVFAGRPVVVEIDDERQAFRALRRQGTSTVNAKTVLYGWERFGTIEFISLRADGLKQGEHFEIEFRPDGTSDRCEIELGDGKQAFLVQIGLLRTCVNRKEMVRGLWPGP